MIAVTVHYAGLPRSETGKPEEIWSVEPGAVLSELLEAVALKYRWQLEDIAKYIILYNDRSLDVHSWSALKLKENDTLLIMSSIAGG
ncbi:MAG TPA: MoaD/ThiS family protein [Candidatus Limnocylindrales bacterium]|nr:MoaD/ThiS family protein [Candidatus Limnocylindrales bacterium]